MVGKEVTVTVEEGRSGPKFLVGPFRHGKKKTKTKPQQKSDKDLS